MSSISPIEWLPQKPKSRYHYSCRHCGHKAERRSEILSNCQWCGSSYFKCPKCGKSMNTIDGPIQVDLI